MKRPFFRGEICGICKRKSNKLQLGFTVRLAGTWFHCSRASKYNGHEVVKTRFFWGAISQVFCIILHLYGFFRSILAYFLAHIFLKQSLTAQENQLLQSLHCSLII